MVVDADFVADIVDKLSPLGAAGLFIDGKMFAKISPSNVVSFKADTENQSKFIEAGMQKSGKMPYYEATAEQMESPEAFLAVAHLARASALR